MQNLAKHWSLEAHIQYMFLLEYIPAYMSARVCIFASYKICMCVCIHSVCSVCVQN